MKVKELLLNCTSFLTLLKEFAIEAKDIVIKDEKLIFTDQSSTHQDAVQETICIEAKNKNTAYNFFGVLHYNFLNNLAVFEMQGFEKIDDFIDG